MDKNLHEDLNLQNDDQSPQNDILERVNEQYERMVQDVREIINKNEQASKNE